MKNYKTEQEEFWAGNFGNEYIDRNTDDKFIASNIAWFGSILRKTRQVHTIIEFGSNIGLNLLAIKKLLPKYYLSAIEINEKAVTQLRKNIPDIINVFNKSILDYVPPKKEKFDLVLIKGVLIHINPERLNDVYVKLYESTKRYILIAEYYNPVPVAIKYRGNENKLFKRDFAGEIMDIYSNLFLLDYGFAYHRDNNFKQDDFTWFLLEKT